MDTQNLPLNSVQESQTGQLASDVVKYELEVSDILDELEHSLRGESVARDEDGKYFWKKAGMQKVSDEGIKSLISDVGSRMSRNIILSDLNEEDIKRMTYDLSTDITLKMAMNWKKWDINKSEMTSMKNLIRDIVFISLRRAWKGMTINLLNRQFTRSETIYPIQKKNMISSNPFFQRREEKQ